MKRARRRQGTKPESDLVATRPADGDDATKHAAVLADGLDKEQIDQLHAATLQVSGNCFELKKLCATVLVAAGTLIVTLSNRELDHALFAGGLVVVVLFWAADAQSYYIQAKLRVRMKELQQIRIRRLSDLGSYDVDGVGLPIDDQPERWRRILKAFVNASMLYYFLTGGVLIAVWGAFGLGLLR